MKLLAPLALLAWFCAACASAAVPPYPAATLPLTGAEELICWQGGVTKTCTTQSASVSGGSSTAAIGTVPLWNNFESSGDPGLFLNPSLVFGDPNGGPLDSFNFEITRQAHYTGGTPFFVNSAFAVETDVSAGTTSDEWAGRFLLQSHSASADGSENVALQATSRKFGSGVTFASNFTLEDESANPVTTSVTNEQDLDVVGLDNGLARINLDLWGRSFLQITGNPCSPASNCFGTISAFQRFDTDAYTLIGDVLEFNLGTRGCTNFINDLATSKFKVTCGGALTAASFVAAGTFLRPGQTAFASLGTADPSPQVGDMLNITDASACTVNTAVSAGGGTTHSCPTTYNGANWIALVTH